MKHLHQAANNQYVSLYTYLFSDQSAQYSVFQESVKSNWKEASLAWKAEFWIPYSSNKAFKF